MAQYADRTPETPEEIKVAKQDKQIQTITMVMSMAFYIVIFLLVPEVPDSGFYLMLDNFLNSYCLGDLMPRFSPEFHFTMKVAWCLSLPYSLFWVLIFAIFIHIKWGMEGVRIYWYLAKYDTWTTKGKIIFFLVILLLISAGFWFSILYYAFGGDPDLSFDRTLDAIFYGNFFRSTLLFLFLHNFFVRGGIYVLLLQLYFTLFVRRFN